MPSPTLTAAATACIEDCGTMCVDTVTPPPVAYCERVRLLAIRPA
jgi:hypothetical protein